MTATGVQILNTVFEPPLPLDETSESVRVRHHHNPLAGPDIRHNFRIPVFHDLCEFDERF